MVNARKLMVQAMLSRVIARGTKVKIWTLSTLPPDPMDVALVTRTTADAWMKHACIVDGMFAQRYINLVILYTYIHIRLKQYSLLPDRPFFI